MTSLKGQLISKCLFGVFKLLQKTNENKSHSSKIEFVRLFFGGNVGLKKLFQFCLTFRESMVMIGKNIGPDLVLFGKFGLI